MFKYLIFILLLVSNAYAGDEICGDGVDNAGVGGVCTGNRVPAKYGAGCDTLCTAGLVDRDGDTYGINGLSLRGAGRLAGKDCDDTDASIYPNRPTTKGCSVGQFRTCQADGTYDACTPLNTYCPTAPPYSCGACYYFNKTTGSNANPGTYASPWRDLRMFVTYYTGGDEPAGYHSHTPNDCYIETGGATYTDTFSYNGTTSGAFFRNKNGVNLLKLPGIPRPKLRFGGSFGAPINAVHFQNVNGFRLDGYEVSLSYAQLGAVYLEDNSSNGTFEDVDIVDNSTIPGSNGSGLQLGGVTQNINFFNSRAQDNFAPTDLFNNNQNIIDFRGINTFISGATIRYSNPLSARGDGFKRKHSNPTSSAKVFGTVFQGMNEAIHTGGGNEYYKYNRSDNNNGYFYTSRDLGGPTYQVGVKEISHNTITKSKFAFLEPTKGWLLAGGLAADACSGDATVTPWIFHDNIVIDGSTSYTQDTAFIKVHPYGPDSSRAANVPVNLDFTNNCEYNSTALALNMGVYRSNDGNLTCSGRGNNGNDYVNFAAWQAATYDAGSLNISPNLDVDGRAQAAGCTTRGWRTLSETDAAVAGYYKRRTRTGSAIR